MTPAEIWKKLTPSQRVTLLREAGIETYDVPSEIAIAVGIQPRRHSVPAGPSGTARHALGRRGLLAIGQTIPMPTSAAGFHTPRELTPLGREVVAYARALLGGAPSTHATKKVNMPKKSLKTQSHRIIMDDGTLNPIEAVRRVMRSSGFDEEEAYGQRDDELLFSSREDGDVAEGRADPGTVQFAREKAKEVEAAVPGAKARVGVVDEWVSVTVTLPPGSPPRVPTPEPEPAPRAVVPTTSSRQRTSLKPGDEVKYTNFTIGGSYEGTAIVTWDHGKSVEARTLRGEKLRLERAADGSLRRFT
ncbi:MAG TPA: hypothetical protein VLE97_01405 [Gaiellaceae bacterium]|nr:hypothetical protein [Gaiellaceae bacterium]